MVPKNYKRQKQGISFVFIIMLFILLIGFTAFGLQKYGGTFDQTNPTNSIFLQR